MFKDKGFERRFENLSKLVKEGEEYYVDILETGSKGNGLLK